ncbi:YciI family protein [Kordiimonas sp.]|uniref:YciI family protein n=1 Tax=Kordiimonas sp. TaxID=1970157 RepID=UPI003A9315CB
MRVMILIKADKNTEAGVPPTEQLLTDMMRFNEELVNAGVMQTGDGLTPTSQGARVHFTTEGRTVETGPFPELGQLICGFWLWKVDSLEDAISWVKKCPMPLDDRAELEIRPLYEIEDLGEAATPELVEKNDELRRRTQSAA